MRHIATLIAAIFIAPLAWALAAFGEDRSDQAFKNATANGGFHTGDFLRPVLFLAVAGILVGLIATLRVSPLGAVFAGVLYTGSYLSLLVTPKRMSDLFSHKLSVFGREADLSSPLRHGTIMLLGVAMLLAAASRRRWLRWPGTEGARDEMFSPLNPTTSVDLGSSTDTTTTGGFASGFDETRYDSTGFGGSGSGGGARFGDLARAVSGDPDSPWGDSLSGGGRH